MALVISGSIEAVLAGHDVQGGVVVEAWGLGVDCKAGVYVLNLYSQGRNYPEIIAPAAVSGVVGVLSAAQGSGAKVHYWPSDTASILFVGRFAV